jgi:hypothetical protein
MPTKILFHDVLGFSFPGRVDADEAAISAAKIKGTSLLCAMWRAMLNFVAAVICGPPMTVLAFAVRAPDFDEQDWLKRKVIAVVQGQRARADLVLADGASWLPFLLQFRRGCHDNW